MLASKRINDLSKYVTNSGRTPLFPTVRSDYLSLERLTQILWEMDEKIRRHHASQQLATPLQRRKVSETIIHQRCATEQQNSRFRGVMDALQSRIRMLTRPRKEMQVRSNENVNGIRTISMLKG